MDESLRDTEVAATELTTDGREETLGQLSRRLHQHLSLAHDALTSNKALHDVLADASAIAGASGFASVTQRLVDTNGAIQDYTGNVARAIESAVSVFQGLTEAIDRFEEEFRELTIRIEAMQKNTRQISQIAFQSKLVAFNASVEAAHLGDAGASFNVVASEIGRLAEQSRGISDQVELDLKSLQEPLEATSKQFNANRDAIHHASGAVSELESSAKGMQAESDSLAVVTNDVEQIAFKQVELQEYLERIGRHSEWVGQATTVLCPELAETSERVDRLWQACMPSESRSSVSSLQQFEDALYRAIVDDNPHAAERALADAMERGLDAEALMARISVASERNHVAQIRVELPTETIYRNGEILRRVIGGLEEHLPKRPTGVDSPERPVVILGNAFEDYHDLGRRLVGHALRGAGFDVVDLGLSVRNDAFVETARRTGARIIGVSSLLLHTARWIPMLKDALHRANLGHVRVIAGGAPFLVDPNLCDEFGADGVARSPNDAVRLVRSLLVANGSGALR